MTGTKAIIHLENLKHNVALVRKLVGPDCKICFPVKANGYGHGMVPLAHAALDYGCDTLAVARTIEAKALREEGITAPILIMGHVPQEELDTLVSLNIEPFVGSSDYIQKIEASAKNQNKTSPLGVHLKIDTGMGRIGCTPQEALALAQEIFTAPHLRLAGFCTHFAVGDQDDIGSVNFTTAQITQLKEIAQEIKSLSQFAGNGDFLIHGANSGGVIQHRESYLNMVRPGILLYGYEPLPLTPVGVRPLMELVSTLTFTKKVKAGQTISYGRTWQAKEETWIGTIPIGYGDGYSRHLSNKGKVWIKDKFYPVVGRVCMDQIMVDLGSEIDWKGKEGTKVILFGPTPSHFSAAYIAQSLGTISYEVCCLITGRVTREYTKENQC